MEDLIKALQILMKYCGNEKYPTRCEHDELFINVVNPTVVSPEDLKELEKLGVDPNPDTVGFVSYRFGSN